MLLEPKHLHFFYCRLHIALNLANAIAAYLAKLKALSMLVTTKCYSL